MCTQRPSNDPFPHHFLIGPSKPAATCSRHEDEAAQNDHVQESIHLASLSKSGDAREIKVPQNHCRHQELARFRGDRFGRFGEGFHLFEDAQGTLMEPEVSHSRCDLAIFYEERAVSRHPCQCQIRVIDRPDVPEIRDENGALALLDEILRPERGRTGGG